MEVSVGDGSYRSVMADVPTIAEAGINSYAFAAWYGIVAPAGLPAPITQKLHAEATRAMQAQEVKDRLLAEDMDVASVTLREMDDARRGELAKWTKIVKQLDLRFE